MQELLQYGEDGVEQKKEGEKRRWRLCNSIGNVTSASMGRTRHGHTEEEYGSLGWTSKLFAIRRDELPFCNFACVKIARLKCKKGYELGIDSSSLDTGPQQPYLASS